MSIRKHIWIRTEMEMSGRIGTKNRWVKQNDSFYIPGSEEGQMNSQIRKPVFLCK